MNTIDLSVHLIIGDERREVTAIPYSSVYVEFNESGARFASGTAWGHISLDDFWTALEDDPTHAYTPEGNATVVLEHVFTLQIRPEFLDVVAGAAEVDASVITKCWACVTISATVPLKDPEIAKLGASWSW